MTNINVFERNISRCLALGLETGKSLSLYHWKIALIYIFSADRRRRLTLFLPHFFPTTFVHRRLH